MKRLEAQDIEDYFIQWETTDSDLSNHLQNHPPPASRSTMYRRKKVSYSSLLLLFCI